MKNKVYMLFEKNRVPYGPPADKAAAGVTLGTDNHESGVLAS